MVAVFGQDAVNLTGTQRSSALWARLGSTHADTFLGEGRLDARLSRSLRAVPRGGFPFSHRQTVDRLTPARSASPCWVSP